MVEYVPLVRIEIGGKFMRNAIVNILLTILALMILPSYATVYGILKLFRIKGHEYMPTIAEFVSIRV